MKSKQLHVVKGVLDTLAHVQNNNGVPGFDLTQVNGTLRETGQAVELVWVPGANWPTDPVDGDWDIVTR